MIDKDRAVHEWAAANPFLTDALLFQFLGDAPRSCAIVPVPGAGPPKVYISGAAMRVYDFALQVVLGVSTTTDGVNTDNLYLQRLWVDWIEGQQRDGKHPDFGPGCSGYRIEVLSDAPMFAQQMEHGTAKYQFFARVRYLEEG